MPQETDSAVAPTSDGNYYLGALFFSQVSIEQRFVFLRFCGCAWLTRLEVTLPVTCVCMADSHALHGVQRADTDGAPLALGMFRVSKLCYSCWYYAHEHRCSCQAMMLIIPYPTLPYPMRQ